MSSSSSIAPAEARSARAPRRAGPGGVRTGVAWGLIGIWALLMAFAVVSLIGPSWLKNVSRPGRETEARGFRNSGDQCMREGRPQEALRWYEWALRADPQDLASRVNAAIARGKLGRLDEGMRLLRDALDADMKGRGTLLYNLAEMERQAGRGDDALHTYQEALEAGGTPELIHGRLGDLWAERGERAKARDAYLEALRCREDPVLIYRRMLVSTRELMTGDSAEARVIGETLDRGTTESDLERYDLDYVRAQVERDPERARLLARLGLLEARLGDRAAASEHLRKAMPLLPPGALADSVRLFLAGI
jgi:tetratricopeptide (TPR) repeat protein